MCKCFRFIMIVMFVSCVMCCSAASHSYEMGLDGMDPVLSFRLRVNGWVKALVDSGADSQRLGFMVDELSLGQFHELFSSSPELQADILPAYFLQCGEVDYPYDTILIYKPMKLDEQIIFGDDGDKLILRNERFFEVWDLGYTDCYCRIPVSGISLIVGCPDGRFIAGLSGDRKKLCIIDSSFGDFRFDSHIVVQTIPFDVEIKTIYWKSKDDLCVCFDDGTCMHLRRVNNFAQNVLILLIENIANKILALPSRLTDALLFLKADRPHEDFGIKLEQLKRYYSEEYFETSSNELIDQASEIISRVGALNAAFFQIAEEFGSAGQDFIKGRLDRAKKEAIEIASKI